MQTKRLSIFGVFLLIVVHTSIFSTPEQEVLNEAVGLLQIGVRNGFNPGSMLQDPACHAKIGSCIVSTIKGFFRIFFRDPEIERRYWQKEDAEFQKLLQMRNYLQKRNNKKKLGPITPQNCAGRITNRKQPKTSHNVVARFGEYVVKDSSGQNTNLELFKGNKPAGGISFKRGNIVHKFDAPKGMHKPLLEVAKQQMNVRGYREIKVPAPSLNKYATHKPITNRFEYNGALRKLEKVYGNAGSEMSPDLSPYRRASLYVYTKPTKGKPPIKPGPCASSISSKGVSALLPNGTLPNGAGVVVQTMPFTSKELKGLKEQLVKKGIKRNFATRMLQNGDTLLQEAGDRCKQLATKEAGLLAVNIALIAHGAKTITEHWPHEKSTPDSWVIRDHSRACQPNLSYRQEDSIDRGEFGSFGVPSLGW